LADQISLGVLTARFPVEVVDQVLFTTERLSERERELPAHLMVYYAIALALYAEVSTREVLRCVVEGARWLGARVARTVPTKSGISQARTRLGAAPLEALYREVVTAVATAGTPGTWYRGWRVMTLDGTTLDVGDTRANARAFGRPASARGVHTTAAFPQVRVVGLLENGTHVITGAEVAPSRTSEGALAATVVLRLTSEMLCLADRGFLSYGLWQRAAETGAALLWRARSHFALPVLERYADGSYRSTLQWYRRRGASVEARTSVDAGPLPVRVIDYTLPGVATPANGERSYRLVTTILEPARAPAMELAALYHERWEMETAFDELKTHLRGAQRVLRSKTPALVYQEAWGFLLAHFAIRALMHEAALGALPRARDPDTLSFTHALRVARRTLPHVGAIPPSGHAAPGAGPPAHSRRTARRTRDL
jgi:hypothetical protein